MTDMAPPNKCPKCGSSDLWTSYHKQGCSKPLCSCAECSYGSHAKRHDEHLHRGCRVCQFDWTEDVLMPKRMVLLSDEQLDLVLAWAEHVPDFEEDDEAVYETLRATRLAA